MRSGATKDEVFSLHSQVGRDKEAMEEEYQKALEVIFAYRYGCCVFKHNICGDHPKVPRGMPNSANPLPPECFCEPRLKTSQIFQPDFSPKASPPPPRPTAAEATTTEVAPNETPKEPMEVAAIEDQSRL